MRTPLQKAVETGNLELVNVLLNAGADVNAPAARARGGTALQLAAICGFLEIADILVEAGANINASPGEVDGRTALEGAAEHGRIDMLHFLLQKGAEIDKDQRKHYQRAIKYALSCGHNAAANVWYTHSGHPPFR
ncbi:ankyrin repeat-containing domain protein, partial [Bombardia bombarda]